MASASKSTNLYSNNGGAYPLGVSFDETQTSTTNNTSTLSLNGYLQAVGEYWSTGYASTLTIGWHDNRRNEDVNVSSITFYGMAERETKNISGSITVAHKDDGTLSGYAYIVFNKGQTTSWYAPNSGSVSTDLTPLTDIARYPLITSAPNFNDEENPTIQFTTSLGFEGATVEAGIKTDLNASPIIPYRTITVADGNYTFNLTTNERNALRNATPDNNNLTIYFVLKTTTTNDVEYFSTLQKTMSIINANPTFTHTEEELNQNVINALGTSSADLIIQNVSNIRITTNPTALKGSSIYSVVINHGNLSYTDTTSPYVIDIPVTTNQFRVNVVDSRGNFTREYLTKTLIEYEPVSINSFSFVRYNPTSSNIILNMEAVYYQQTFGNTANVPTVKWKLDDGSFVTIPSSNYTIDTTNHKLTITNYELTNALVYTSSGQFTIYIEDLLTNDQEAGTNGFVLKGIPTFDYGEHDLKVNGDLYIADEDGENAINVLDKLNGSIGEILWTNSNPTVGMNQTTITLSSSDYDMLEIFYIDYIRNERYYSVRVPKGKPVTLQALFDYVQTSGMYFGERTIYYTNDTELWANDCYSAITNTQLDRRTSNEWCVPVYIVGYNTGLF